MGQNKIIDIEGIGEVLLKKDKKFSRLSLRIAPTKGIWVNIPSQYSFLQGERFAVHNKEWILKNRSKIQEKESQQTIFSSQIAFRTRYHNLQIKETTQNHLSASINKGVLQINRPKLIAEENLQVQKFIREAVIETLRREAKYYLPKRVQQLARQHNFLFKSVKIRNAKTRWGSCSFDNNINLNLHLMRLPQNLADYIILHELCHTIEKNHSDNFWKLMKKVCPEVRNNRKELKNYSLVIF